MKQAFLKLHIAVLLAGFTGILGRLISLEAVALVWYRVLIASACFWLLFAWQGKLQKINRADIFRLLGVGTITALHWITFYASIKFSNVSVGLVCLSCTGFFTSLLEPAITRKKHQLTEVLLGVLSIIGIYIIFHFDSKFRLGISFGLVSAFLAALFPIFMRQSIQRINIQTGLTWQMTGCILGTTVLLPLFLQLAPTTHFVPTTADWFWLIILAVLCTVVAMQFSMVALKKFSAFTVTLSYNLEPVYGVLLAFFMFNEMEVLGSSFFIGFAIIMSSLVIHTLLLRRQTMKDKQVAANLIP
jgi:drug/metabolite transporter (DMT)-like permease